MKLLKILEEEKIVVKFSIYLHKFDLDFTLDVEVLEKLKNDILEKIPKEFDYSIYRTNIITALHKRTLAS